MPEIPSATNDYLAKHVRLLVASYRKFLGADLLSKSTVDDTKVDDSTVDIAEVAKQVFEAQSVVLSHGTEADPIFNYANLAAMKLFEMDWSTITQLPSRKSAEPMNRAERERLLAAVTAKNYIDDYSGVRISSTGRRFFIPKAIVWNLVDEEGQYCGQAATFAEWDFLE